MEAQNVISGKSSPPTTAALSPQWIRGGPEGGAGGATGAMTIIPYIDAPHIEETRPLKDADGAVEAFL